MIVSATYTRVSSERQREEKTIESQQKALREIWQKAGENLYKDYIDDGWSGETLARPGLDQLRDDARRGLFQKLYIHHPDRLGRDHIDQGIVLRELKKQGVQVIFKDVPLTDDNKLQRDIESLLAEYENKQRRERSRRGKLHRAKEGRIIVNQAPFGYKLVRDGNDRKIIVIDENEAQTVRLIFQLYLQLQSNYKVSEELEKRGILSRTGKKFDPVKVHPILVNETYTGVWHYGKYETCEPKFRKAKFSKHLKTAKKINSEWVKYEVPVIIERELFDKVQELKKKTYKLFGEAKRPYLLTGLIRHETGERLAGFTYYRNNKQYSYYKRPKFFLNINRIDGKVWSLIVEALKNPEVMQEYMEHLKEDSSDFGLLAEKGECQSKLNRVKSKKQELWNMWDKDFISKTELSKKITDYGQEEKRLGREMQEIGVRLSQMKNRELIVDTLQRTSKVLAIQLDIFTAEERKKFLNFLIKEITIDDDGHFEIKGELPVFDGQGYLPETALSRQSLLQIEIVRG